MRINPFRLERFYARYEFSAQYMLSSSDCESLGMNELLQMADPNSLRLWQDLKLGYTESQGHPLLREEVSRLYRHIPAEQVLVAAPEEAIFIAMQTLLSPGEQVIAVSPTYQSLYEIARSIGCYVKPWPLQLRASGWHVDLDLLEHSITPATRLLVLNFPNNPTGCLPTLAEFEAIIALARKNHLTVFSEEMYRLLEPDPALRLPAVCDAYERGISLSGLSKSFAAPGLRIGWLAAQDRDLPLRWLGLKDYTTICNSAPSEVLGIIALQNKDQIVQRNCWIIEENLKIAGRFFNENPHLFAWLPPDAGSIAFPRWLGSEPVEQFCQQLVDQQSVMLVPGGLFDMPGDHFRLGLGRRNFGEALGRVESFLRQRE